MGSVSTTQTSICCRSSGTTARLTTRHCTSSTLMDRDITTTKQFQKRIQDISAYEMIHPVIHDALKVSTAINNLHGPIQQHLLLQVRPHHTWQKVRQMIDNFFANSYMHLPGQTVGNVDQDINIVRTKYKGKKRKRKRKERKRKGLQQ